MEIYVEGRGGASFMPDQVRMNFTFNKTDKTYEGAVKKGVEDVANYVEFLTRLGFEKSKIKTLSFRVRENTVWNENLKKNVKDGFIFSQEMKVVYDYDVERFAQILEETSKVKNPPLCRISFELKDERRAEMTLYTDCVKDARLQAEIIASASGLKLTKCLKISCSPFDGSLSSSTHFGRDGVMSKCACEGVRDNIVNNFTPEEITLSHTLYALWLAE